MDGLGRPIKWYEPPRRKPISLTWPATADRPAIATIGHYDVACGGCDTIKSRSIPFELARKAMDQGYNVMFEGLFVGMEFHRSLELMKDGYEQHNIFLNKSVKDCTAAVMERRAKSGKPPKVLKQMAANHPRVLRTEQRLREAGVPTEIHDDYDTAFQRVKELLYDQQS